MGVEDMKRGGEPVSPGSEGLGGRPPEGAGPAAEAADWDRVAGDWTRMGEKARAHWGRLSEEDLRRAGGRRDVVLDLLREHYGLGPEEARRQLDDWASRHGSAASIL